MTTKIQRFIHNLNDFSSVCKNDLTEMRLKEQNLDNNFKDLQTGVKKSLLYSNQKVSKVYESPLAMRRRLFPSERPLPLPPIKKRQAQSDMALRPAPFPTRHYALKARPCEAAKRFYRPKALLQRQEEKLEQIDDFMKCPSPEIAANLNGTVDPTLHIGTFNDSELKWSEPINTQSIYN